MINRLKLTCFRKHIDREFHFTKGINAIRGANENGKTTVTEAFAYLVFGARALRESLDDVVTYDTPVSKLRVEGSLTHLGVEYMAYRAKSGAEVTFGKERITGQTEVTEFFEKLFGVDAKMAGKLMISSQKAIAASITAGPTEAGQTIEALANFDLIEQIVELAQKKLVAGVTTGVEARIEQLRGQVAEAPAEAFDITMLELDVTEKEVLASTRRIETENIQTKRDDLDLDLAKSILADEKRLQDVISTAAYDLDRLDRALAVEAPSAPAPAEIESARAAVEAEKQVGKAVAIHADLVKSKIVDLWDKDLVSLEAEIAATQTKVDAANTRRETARDLIASVDSDISKLQRESAAAIATLEGRLIKETTCAFCDKDLTDVPEVVKRNSAVGRELEDLTVKVRNEQMAFNTSRAGYVASRDAATKERQEASDYLDELRAVVTANDKVETLYAKAADFITVDRSTVPGLWTWTGPAVTGERPNVAGALRALEQRQTEAVAFAATRAAQRKQHDELKTKQAAAIKERNALLLQDAKETIALVAMYEEQLEAARAALDLAKGALSVAQANLKIKIELQKQAAAAAALTKKQLAAAEKELADMQSNNALIKKVRAARPVITNKLWSIVLASSSNYFSQVRGEPSSITRDEKMFRCNGKPAAGLSGSAEDMLGLAVRISLTKTFLSSLGFLILDEPAAACSDARESSMLGMLSTLGFEQILLVTHSDLCDSYSDNMILV